MSETYGHVLPSQALRPAIYGAKQRLTVFTEFRLIKKERKNTSNPKQPSVPAYAATGGCKNSLGGYMHSLSAF